MQSVINRICAFLLSILQILFMSVSYGKDGKKADIIPTPTQIINDISGDTSLSQTIKYSSRAKNVVQCVYTDSSRDTYVMRNGDMTLTHSLTAHNNGATLASSDGGVYLDETFDTFYTDVYGKTHYSNVSSTAGRVNTIRLGEYYYECHVRDFDFALSAFKVDKAYHVFADRLYQELSLVAVEATDKLARFGSEIRIDAKKVASVQIKDSSGLHSSHEGIDTKTVKYAAFDINDVGVVGFIVPSDGSCEETEVLVENGFYVVRQYASFVSATGINKYDETGGYELNSVKVGCRVWTGAEHGFDKVDAAARLERNPLEGITVGEGNAHAAYIGYEALRGTYTLRADGTDFQYAYDNPDVQYKIPIAITCDNSDRDIFLRCNGEIGCLEAAALLDDTGVLVPVDVQVCKNFGGDGGESFYGALDRQYGDSFFPISLKAGETLSLTLLNLYQNWGKYPLKQLSSIEFHVSYYHLSTGTTESNCIAPYYVIGRDGWTLPDFRGRSGKMWSDQPQFNSVGILKFARYDSKILGSFGNEYLSEYTGCNIASVGQTYADITNSFVSDCGSYTYSLRHVEFPQTDENRTYYSLNIEFNREISFKNFKRDFDLFYFDGRYVTFDKAGYLDENNKPQSIDLDNDRKYTDYYPLGNQNPYFGFYSVSDATKGEIEKHFGSNFALIVKNSSMVIGGEPSDIGFAFRSTVKENMSIGALTLDKRCLTFEPGDSISIDLILLPWGTGLEENDSTVLNVREDSAQKPLTVTAKTGKVIDDAWIPTVECVENEAEFTISGSRNNNVFKVSGFTSLICPDVYQKRDSEWCKVDLASSNGYDGYAVQYNKDGTYSFSFVYFSENPDIEYDFKVVRN